MGILSNYKVSAIVTIERTGTKLKNTIKKTGMWYPNKLAQTTVKKRLDPPIIPFKIRVDSPQWSHFLDDSPL